MRVVIADDHPVVREGLAAMLDSVGGINVVGLAADGHDALRAAVTLRPDVIVLDIQMPGTDGISAAAAIAKAAPKVGILMLTMLDDPESVRAALRAGASGYVLKGASQQQIVRAVHAVADGDSVLGAGINLLDAAARPDPGPLAGLTPREREVLDLLVADLPTSRIAERLGVATKTVTNNLSAIFAKLGVPGRAEAVVIAKRHGIGGTRGGSTP